MSPTPGSCPMDLNRGAIFEDTSGVRPSAPLHVGAYSRAEEREKLRSCYSLFHNFKPQMNTKLDIFSHPRSYRLLAGTNEYAEDLTGQRQPMNASQWRSETQVTHLHNYFNIHVCLSLRRPSVVTSRPTSDFYHVHSPEAQSDRC